MSEADDRESLRELANGFYKTLAANEYFSSQKKAATALENLVEEVSDLKTKIDQASRSSDRLAKSLNWLTGAALVIAGAGIGLEVYKVFIMT
ncbi:hypothetical protein GLV89_11360 [Halomonas alkaliantarctica]|nr:hypothetical protein [Halomonas alkaliantarctica]